MKKPRKPPKTYQQMRESLYAFGDMMSEAVGLPETQAMLREAVRLIEMSRSIIRMNDPELSLRVKEFLARVRTS